MVAWWPLDELTGTSALDVIGGNNGSAQGGTSVVDPGEVAAARAFDGASGMVVVPDVDLLDPADGDFSLDAWIRPDALDGRRPIITKIYAPADAPLGYSFALEDGALSLAMSNDGSSLSVTSPPVLAGDGRWHFVAATIQRDSQTGGHLYVDGELIHSFDTAPLSRSVDTGAQLLIASQPALGRGSRARFFSGAIDEVEVFRHALSETEVLAIFQAGALGKCGKPSPPPSRAGPSGPVRKSVGFW